MAQVNTLTDIRAPGTYIVEGTFGAYPSAIATHSAIYMVGTGSISNSPRNIPTYVTSLADFTNIFGTSPSARSIELYFAQKPGLGLWFVNTEVRVTRTITIPTATVGQVYSLTVDGYLVGVTAVTGDTVVTILNKLTTEFNSRAGHLGIIRNGILRTLTATSVTSSANVTLGTVSVAGTATVHDALDTLAVAFNTSMPAGYIIAPEFFQGLTNQADRTMLALGMEATARDLGWVAIADCGASVSNATTGAGAVNLALAEVAALSAPQGHLAYYFPYWVDTLGNNVPASASVCGVAVRRYREQGFREPPAGISYPVRGVQRPTFNVTYELQEVLNAANVNCLRQLPGKGNVVYGARTVSSNQQYRYVTTRVIMNVLGHTLRTAFDDVIFSSVDGLGILFGRIKQTAAGICERLRLAGALFGATPDDAYRCICDNTNNLPIDLDNGRVTLDVLVKPSPLMEVLLVRLYRASLGTSLVAQQADATIQEAPE